MLKQPVGIVKLTNVALVKYRNKNRKVEIACYKNKVIDWRNGTEENVDNVIQIDQIFSNAIQGTIANVDLLNKLFKTTDKKTIIKKILDDGTLQISKKEREVLTENAYQEVLKTLSNKLIHPKTRRQFSEEAIKNALKSINLKIEYNVAPKRQAFKAMKKLEKIFEVMRTPFLVEVDTDKLGWFDAHGILFEKVSSKKTRTVIVLPSKDYHLVSSDGELLGLNVLDNNYYNKEVVGLDEEIFVELERRPKPLKNQEEVSDDEEKDVKKFEVEGEEEEEDEEDYESSSDEDLKNVTNTFVPVLDNHHQVNYFQAMNNDSSDDTDSSDDNDENEPTNNTQENPTENTNNLKKDNNKPKTETKKNEPETKKEEKKEEEVPQVIFKLKDESKKLLKMKPVKNKKKNKYDRLFEKNEDTAIKDNLLDDLNKPKKGKPKKTGKTKKKQNQGKVQKELERQRELEEERLEKLKAKPVTIQSLGGSLQSHLSSNLSNCIYM